ncbi:MAG: hypothetical protein RL199_1368, partial [Pseudomonadota bacterium]
MIAQGRETDVALVDGDADRVVSFGELRTLVSDTAQRLERRLGGRRLVLLHPEGVDGVVLYLACLEARLPVCLADLSAPASQRLVDAWRPSLVIGSAQGVLDGEALEGLPSTRARFDPAAPAHGLHEDLALLLTTSGSTGDPKLVRLSHRNIVSNADAIATYLGIGPGERALQSLPLHYAYGLSVLNSHLRAGATVVLTQQSFLRPEFWALAGRHAGTSFAGVPYVYETLHRLRFEPAKHPSIRMWTQAGGALNPELVTRFHEKATSAGARFVVMYGQTEATARMSWLSSDRLPAKAGAIGRAIPGGRLRLEPVPGDASQRELVYEGPNVMLGYALVPADLAKGDDLGGVLRTGDLGEQDGDGDFYIRGRLSRFAKLFGHRIGLDDLEREAERLFSVPCAVVEHAGKLVLFCEAAE